MSYQKEEGEDIDNWTLDELSNCIRDYYAYCDQNQQPGGMAAVQQVPAGVDQIASTEPAQYVEPQQRPQNERIAEMNQAMENTNSIEVNDNSDKFFNEADFEDLKAKNTPEGRLFVPTAALEPTALNNKRIKIKVIEGALKSGGIFSASYLLFKITVDPVGWSIQRKDQDFYFLRKMLLKEFPYLIIPCLPLKKKKETEKSIKKREKYFSRFL